MCREVSERILNDKNGLVVRCPAVYGYDLKIGETDLMKFLVNREANCGGWNETAGSGIHAASLSPNANRILATRSPEK